MITYLVIFLSVLAILIVFGRRAYLTLRSGREEVAEVGTENGAGSKNSVNGSGKGGSGEPAGKKKRFSKDDKEEMARLHRRAIAFIKRKEPKEAVKVFVQALAIDPDYKDGLQELGRLYLDQKMWGKAAAVYKHLGELTQDPVDYSHLGLASYNAGDLEEAAKAYQGAVTLDPKRPQRYMSLGHVYRELERPQLALIAFNKALDLDGENVENLLCVANLKIEMGDLEAADEILVQVLEIAPMSKMAPRLQKEIVVKRRESALGEEGGRGGRRGKKR